MNPTLFRMRRRISFVGFGCAFFTIIALLGSLRSKEEDVWKTSRARTSAAADTRLMQYAIHQFGNHSNVIVPSRSSDSDLASFLSSDLGQRTSGGHHIRRGSLIAQEYGGFFGDKPRIQPHINTINTTKRKQALFYALTSADDFYVYQLQLSLCSVRESNKNDADVFDVVVAVVPEYFESTDQLEKVVKWLLEDLHVKVCLWEKLEYGASSKNARFNKNWVRLRLWELDDTYDRIVYMDADTIVTKSLLELFNLDVPFAAANDLDKTGFRFSSFGKLQAGVLLLQPCKQVFLQMRAILEHNDISLFVSDHAEQSFLDWYYKYDGFRLSYQYNAISGVVSRQKLDSSQLSIVHFTSDKISRQSDLSKNMQWMARSCHEKTRQDIPQFG